jgi:hypothetical protein
MYDRWHSALLDLRAEEEPSPSILPSTGDLRTLGGALDAQIDLYATIIDPRVTQDRRRYAEIICSVLPPATWVRDINPNLVKAFLIALRTNARSQHGKPFSSQTQMHVFNFFRAALDLAVDEGLLNGNPASRIRKALKPTPRNEETQFFTVNQMGSILEALRPNAGENAVALLSASRDAYLGPYIQHQLVRIYLLIGEPERALDQLEPLLSFPYFLSPDWLRIDPNFRPAPAQPTLRAVGRGIVARGPLDRIRRHFRSAQNAVLS